MPATKFNEFFLRDVEIFNDCSEHFLQDVFVLSEEVSYSPGEILRSAGRKNTHIWVVISGNVHILDGKNTVFHRNDVVGMHSLINDLSVCVYTVYAAEEEAICIRISCQSLNDMFTKYSQDKVIIIHNSLKHIHRIPRAHILDAMQMQVSNSGNILNNGSMANLNANKFSHCKKTTKSKSVPNVLESTKLTKAHSTVGIEMDSNRFPYCEKLTYSKSVPNVLKFTGSMDGRSTREIQIARQKSLTEMHAVLMAEHADSIAQKNYENSKIPEQKTFEKARRHSVGESFSNKTSQPHKARRHSGGALFYSCVISQAKSKSATKYVRIGQTSHLKLGHKFKFWNFRCMCLSCWVMIALCVTWFSNASLFTRQK